MTLKIALKIFLPCLISIKCDFQSYTRSYTKRSLTQTRSPTGDSHTEINRKLRYPNEARFCNCSRLQRRKLYCPND